MRTRFALLALAGVVAAAVIVTSWPGSSDTQGTQRPGPAVELSSSDTQDWSLLTPSDGSERPGWPRPMIARGDRICFGFENPVFEDDARPSLSRCVDRDAIPELAPTELVVLTSVEAGLDVWHVVGFAAPVIRLELGLEAGGVVAAERLHLDGDVVALRLARDEVIADITWQAGRAEARCEPVADAAETAVFCASPSNE